MEVQASCADPGYKKRTLCKRSTGTQYLEREELACSDKEVMGFGM